MGFKQSLDGLFPPLLSKGASVHHPKLVYRHIAFNLTLPGPLMLLQQLVQAEQGSIIFYKKRLTERNWHVKSQAYRAVSLTLY